MFLGYVVSTQGIQIEDEKIEVIKNWPEFKSVRNIHIFIRFTHFL